MLRNTLNEKSGYLLKALSLCILTIFLLVQPLRAATITGDYTGGTVSGGMLIDPSSNVITISGNTTISGASQVGGSGDSYAFRVGPGNPVSVASGATITASGTSLGGQIAFAFGSETNIAGNVNLNTGYKVRFGVGGPAATAESPVSGTLNVTGSLKVKTTAELYFANGGASGSTATGTDARYTYTLNVKGGTVNLEGSGDFGIGCRNNVNLNVTNGGTLTLKSTTTAAGVCLCGVYGEWGGQENKTFNVNVENGTMTLDTAKDVTIGAAYASYNNNFTRKASFTVGSAGTLELNRTMSNANAGKTTISFAVNGGTLYAKTNDISLTSANSFSITGDAKIKVDNQLTLGAVGGAGSLHKQGAGTLKLTARETYTGTTYVEEGRLILAAEHSGSLKSKTMNVSAGAVLELASKNATDYGINSPDMVLGAKTDSKPGAELNLSMTANAWTSVCKLTMNDGSHITIADNLPKLPILYICKETTVPANATAQIDALVGMRTSGENGNLVNAGKFNIGEGGTLTLTNGLYAWGSNSKTNTLIKQGAGEMIVQGKTYASEGYELRVQVDAGKLVLENVDTVSTKSTFKSVLVKNGAELLLGGTIPSTTAITIEEGAKFGAIGTLTTAQGFEIPTTWDVKLDSTEAKQTSIIALTGGTLTFGENATAAFELVNGTTLESLISIGDIELLNFSGSATWKLPTAANDDWDYFTQYLPEDLKPYYSMAEFNVANGSTSVGLLLNRNAVPEPATLTLLLVGLGIFALRGRRFQRR